MRKRQPYPSTGTSGPEHICWRPSFRGVINGVPVDALGPEDMLSAFTNFLECPEAHVVNHLAAHPFVLARDDTSFRRALVRADLNVADGMAVVWALRLQGFSQVRERVYGPDFLLAAARWGVTRHLRHAFIGGTEDLLARLVANLRVAAPRILIAGTYAPPFRDLTRETVAEDIVHLPSDADVIWVGLGTPKQQLWADLAKRFQPARLIVTVGAAFDFIAGVKRQAPRWFQRIGLEWMFRLATEPRRLWRRYIIGNPRFIWSVLKGHTR